MFSGFPVFFSSITDSAIGLTDMSSLLDCGPVSAQLLLHVKIFICFSKANSRSFVDSFLSRFIPHTNTKIKDRYEGLTEGRNSRTRCDLGEEFDADSISSARCFSVRQEDRIEERGKLPTRYDPLKPACMGSQQRVFIKEIYLYTKKHVDPSDPILS